MPHAFWSSDSAASRDVVVRRVPRRNALACGVSSRHRRSFIACASAFHRDRRVPVATPGRRWLLESCDASILGRGDGPSPIDAEAPTTPRGDPRGRRPCPTDRILGEGRRGRCPMSGLSSPETLVARLRSDGDIGGLGNPSRRQPAVVAGAEARHRRQRRSRGRARVMRASPVETWGWEPQLAFELRVSPNGPASLGTHGHPVVADLGVFALRRRGGRSR